MFQKLQFYRRANCVAYVDGDNIFFKSIKVIKKGKELIVHPQLVNKNMGELKIEIFLFIKQIITWHTDVLVVKNNYI